MIAGVGEGDAVDRDRVLEKVNVMLTDGKLSHDVLSCGEVE